jgi:uncharacterized protein (TIGR03492 family)
MKLLCLSNGHGEDAIALRILQQIQQQPDCPALAALPLVGEGQAYIRQGIPVIGQVRAMPSGGFVYMDGRQLARDLRGGLAQLTWAQIQTIRAWAKEGGMILAVGDIVPLLFAWWSGAPYAFVATAKSEYYIRDEQGVLPRGSWFEQLESVWGSVFLPWEQWLMSRDRCRAVFPRDTFTFETLSKGAIPAFDVGNPMMDGLEPTGMQLPDLQAEPTGAALTIVLMPGSRVPEAYENWAVILEAVAALVAQSSQALRFLAAIDPKVNMIPLGQQLEQQGWAPSVLSLTFEQRNATLSLITSAFTDCLYQADLAIAMAGTATEQFVGLGKPAFTLSGKGPQFTPAFAEAQTRLLGKSVIWVRQPQQLPDAVRSLLQDSQRLRHICENGQRRMGKPGASEQIARILLQGFAT